jgi:hypothetical protein
MRRKRKLRRVNSLQQYKLDTSRPSPRTKRTHLIPPAAGVGTALRPGPPQNLRDVLGCDGRVVERLTAAADPRGVADLPRPSDRRAAAGRGEAAGAGALAGKGGTP